jgi:hypothetical protein
VEERAVAPIAIELPRSPCDPLRVTTGLLLTVLVVAGIVLYRIVWVDRRERRRQYPKRAK